MEQASAAAASTPTAGTTTNLKTRLIIKSMTLENFKSYAGKRTIGPFHKCFTSIVGPNGSGKSNVIDAVLFVFGYRANKMRFKKISELIHKSSENAEADYARVTVEFCDIYEEPTSSSSSSGATISEGEEPTVESSIADYRVVPGSEFSVSRTAKRDNSSNYKLSGKTVTFEDVQSLLMGKGIDLNNNRFLILQGEVEQISQMKPKGQTPTDVGLLEYLEDIIGSNKYVADIESAAKRVEELGALRSLVLTKAKLAETEKDNLEGARNEALAFITAEKSMAKLKRELANRHVSQLTEKLAKLEKQVIELQAVMDEEKQKSCGGDALVAETKEAVRVARENLAKSSEQLANARAEFALFQRRDIKQREDIKSNKALVSKLEEEIKLESDKKDKAAAALIALETDLPQLVDSVSKLESERTSREQELEKVYQSLQAETDTIREEMEAIQKELAPKLVIVDKLGVELESTAMQASLVEKKTMEARKKLQDSQTELAQLQQSTMKKRSLPEAMEGELGKLISTLVQKSEELKSISKVEQEMEGNVKSTREKLELGKSCLELLQSRGQIVNELMAATRTSLKSSGLVGRLGDLGSVDAKYDVAVSTACGALDNLVTLTTAGAEQCVNYLREKNLGRGTFIILEKLKYLENQYKAKIDTPENVPRLFDLIQCKDEKYKTAFYFGLRNTLVCENLDQATRIAYKDGKAVWRVVTLNGELIDTSGTMSGGGNSQRRGGILLLNNDGNSSSSSSNSSSSSKSSSKQQSSGDESLMTREELQVLETSLGDLQKELAKVRDTKRGLERDIQLMERKTQTLEADIAKLRLENEASEEKLKLLESRIQTLKPYCEMTKEEMDQLEEIRKLESKQRKSFEEAKKETDTLKAKVSSLQNQVMKVGGARVQRAKSASESASRELESRRTLVTKAEMELKSTSASVTKSESTLEKSKKALDKAQGELSKLEKEFQEIENEALVVFQSLEKIQDDEARFAKEVIKEEKVLKESEDRLRIGQKKLIEMQGQMEVFKEDFKELGKGIKSWNDEIAQQVKNLQEYGVVVEKNKKQKRNTAAVEEEEKGDELVSAATAKKTTTGVGEEDEEEEDDEDELKVDVAKLDNDHLEAKIATLQSESKKLQQNVNMGAIQEYNQREAEYLEKVKELDDATGKRDLARLECESLRKKRLDEFMSGFSIITLKLKEMYQMITLGGDAELELVDSLDPFSEGIVFSVRPPKKSWKNISNLSGGEKTLSSLALVFALHHYKPTPLYIMDEIDAALDFKNVSIVANYVAERTKNAQFIIISLRNNMFELADRLVGIYKTNNATKSVTIDPTLGGQVVPVSQ